MAVRNQSAPARGRSHRVSAADELHLWRVVAPLTIGSGRFPPSPNDRARIPVLLALTLLFPVITHAQGPSSGEPGATWAHLSGPERLAYAIGFRDGASEAGYPYLLVTGRLPLVTDAERRFVGSLTPQQPAAYRRVYEERYLVFATDTLDLGAVAGAMTRLYRDRANRAVDFAAMFRVAVMQLHGESAERVQRQLGVQREAAAARETDRKPGH